MDNATLRVMSLHLCVKEIKLENHVVQEGIQAQLGNHAQMYSGSEDSLSPAEVELGSIKTAHTAPPCSSGTECHFLIHSNPPRSTDGPTRAEGNVQFPLL